MTGVQHVRIYDDRIMYEFDLYRNITIIRGDTATGKTVLYDMIDEYNKDADEPTRVHIECEKACIVFTGDYVGFRANNIRNSIVFIDEGTIRRSKSYKLAELIKGSDNYFVLITRDDMVYLPYSITEIYRVKMSNKFASLYKVYNQLDRIYGNEGKSDIGVKKNVVITEDSGSGHEAFKKLLPNCKVESANGKSNMVNMLNKHPGEEVALIADGAAFGPEIGHVLERIDELKGKAVLYAPESFEWLLLNLRMFKGTEEKIRNTSDYADSVEYESWEQYYLELLKKELRKKGIRYNKNHMPKQLLGEGTLEQIKQLLPNIFE